MKNWMAMACCFAIAEIPLFGQIGGPSPGQYPGQYPGGGGIGFPRRGKQKSKTTKQKDAPEELKTIEGLLRQIDEKFVIIEAQDTRIINCKRSDRTKFFRNGEEIKPADLKPGTHVLIEASQDEEGFLTAVNVQFQKEGSAAEREAARERVDVSTQKSDSEDERPVLRRSDSPGKDSSKQEPAVSQSTNSPKSEPVPAEAPSGGAGSAAAAAPDDDYRPRLKRGKPAPRKRAAAAEPSEQPQQVARADARRETPESVVAEVQPPVAPAKPEEKPDPVVEKARSAAATFTQGLPNYMCQEMIARFATNTHIVSWRPLDVVTAEVVYENGREQYRNLAINGKPSKKAMNELSGAWSTGEFGTVLVDLFSPATAAEFHFRKESRIAGLDARVYDFSVDRENSHWSIMVASQMVRPAYRGSVWIDKESARVLRIEMQSRNMPEEFPMDKAESSTDYEYVRLGEQQFLLPVHAEVLSCQRGTNICTRNAIDFRNYHKYAGESSITFGK